MIALVRGQGLLAFKRKSRYRAGTHGGLEEVDAVAGEVEVEARAEEDDDTARAKRGTRTGAANLASMVCIRCSLPSGCLTASKGEARRVVDEEKVQLQRNFRLYTRLARKAILAFTKSTLETFILALRPPD